MIPSDCRIIRVSDYESRNKYNDVHAATPEGGRFDFDGARNALESVLRGETLSYRETATLRDLLDALDASTPLDAFEEAVRTDEAREVKHDVANQYGYRIGEYVPVALLDSFYEYLS